MKFFFRRGRMARRRPVLDETSSKPRAPMLPSAPDLAKFGECAGRPYLIGAGTFLVALYLERMSREEQESDRK